MVYDEPELLEYLCIFDSEQQRLCKTWLTKRNLIRIIFIGLLVPLITGWFFLYGWAGYVKSLANWGVFLVISSLICSSMVPYSKNYRRKPRLMALNHALFSMAILIQLLDFFSYWLTFNRESSKIKKNKHTELIVFYQYALHIVPPLACMYNFAITDFLFYRKFYKVSLFGTVLYLVANYIKDRHWQDFLISQGLGGP